MPNLRRLQINDYAVSTLPANMLNNLHGLEVFGLQHSEVEIIPGDFFTYVTSCRNFVLNENKIQTIDLGSLNPNTSVDLSYNQIKQLPEKNFRIFVENVIYAPDAYGIVQLYGKF